MALMTAITLAAALVAPRQEGHARFEGMAMGSSLEIEVFGPDQATCDKAVKEAREEIDRLERIMTDWKQESPLMDVNRAAGRKPVEVPPELYFIIERSLKMSELTEGTFDITFAAAGKLWNWRDPNPRVPTPEEVKAALADVGWKGVTLDAKAGTVFLTRPGMRIGLGGIGPGYAGDLAMD